MSHNSPRSEAIVDKGRMLMRLRSGDSSPSAITDSAVPRSGAGRDPEDSLCEILEDC